jgi:hypothetical protein
MEFPWNMCFSSCLCWNAFSRIIPHTLWNGDDTFTPQQRGFMVWEFLRSNNINLVRQSFTNENPDLRCPSRANTWRASYVWIFVRETLANQVYLVTTEELWYHKSSLLRGKLWHRHFKVNEVLYEKMRFSTNNSKAQIPWKFHGTLMGVKMNS